jgi:hypothetical protein
LPCGTFEPLPALRHLPGRQRAAASLATSKLSRWSSQAASGQKVLPGRVPTSGFPAQRSVCTYSPSGPSVRLVTIIRLQRSGR